MNDIVKQSFYITGLFADIKSDSKWTECEIKTVLMLFSELSKHRVYIPDFYKDKKNKIIDKTMLYESIAKVPREYVFTREEFSNKTSVSKSHLAREINKVRKSLVKKTINTPHPIDQDDFDSGETIAWFSKITYHNKTGEILIKINEDAIDRLVALVNYTKIDFSKIITIKNANSIFYYLFFKIIIDSTTKRYIEVSLKEFKEKINLSDKYIKISHFKEKVLDVIKKDINDITDLNMEYNLIKVGRAFTKIKFTFDYKPEYLEQKAKLKSNKAKQLNVIESTDINNYDSPFEHILTGWNIRARKVVELEEIYSLEVIQQAIDLTLEKEKAGEIKTTKAAIFLGILENKQLASDEQFERAKNELEQQQDKKIREKISAEYDKLSSFILSNQDIIQSALTANTKHLPITDKDAIPVFKKIQSIDADKFRAYTVPILNFHHFESNSNVSSTLSDIADRSQYIEIETYKDDMAIVQAYKKALDKIKEDEYITDEQKDTLRKEVQESINILLGL